MNGTWIWIFIIRLHHRFSKFHVHITAKSVSNRRIWIQKVIGYNLFKKVYSGRDFYDDSDSDNDSNN